MLLHFLWVQCLALTRYVTYYRLSWLFIHFQTSEWIKSSVVLKFALEPGFIPMVSNSVVLFWWKPDRVFAHTCRRCFFFPFSFSRPLCQHNPSIYEITRAHLCSGGSHLGSNETSAGNHLGSTESSLPSTFSVLSALWANLFTLKAGQFFFLWNLDSSVLLKENIGLLKDFDVNTQIPKSIWVKCLLTNKIQIHHLLLK